MVPKSLFHELVVVPTVSRVKRSKICFYQLIGESET